MTDDEAREVAAKRPARFLLGLLGLAGVYLAGRAVLPLIDGRPAVEFWRLAVGVPLFGLAAGACFLRSTRVVRDRRAWLLCGIALSLYPVGTITAEIAGTDTSAPVLAHLAWLSFYGCMYAAVSLLGRSAVRPLPAGFLLDGLVGAISLAAALTLLAEVVGAVPYRLWEGTLGVAYPALDVLLLGFTGWVALAGRARHSASWCWLLSGLAIMALADLLFLLAGVTETLSSVSVYTAGYPIAAVAIAIAAWQPPPPPSPLRVGAARSLVGPGVSVSAALIVLAAAVGTGLSGPAAAFALIALAIAFVRGWLVYRDLDALQESRRFERGFEEAGIGMALLSEDGRWVRVNAALAALLGADRRQLTGEPFSRVIAPVDRDRVERIEAQLRAGARRVEPMPLRALRADGSVLEVTVAADVIRAETGELQLFAQLRDVTAERRATRFSEATARLSRAALVEPHMEDLLPVVAAELTDTLGLDLVAILLQDDADDTLRVIAPGADLTEALRHALVEADDPIGEALTTGRPVEAIAAPGTDPLLALALEDSGLATFHVVPIEPTVGAPGAICLGSRLPGPPPGTDGLLFADAIANLLASALDRARREALSQHQALHDPLTGLANRALLTAHLAHAVEAGRRTDGCVGVVLLDLDRFKNVNDTLGHDIGDALLCAVTARLLAETRGSDLVARLGGDEFVVVFDRIGSADDILPFARRLIAALAAPIQLGQRELYAGASLGIVAQDAATAAPETLLRDADVAMYRAKDGGGGRFEVFDADLRARVVRRTTTEHELRHAVERGEMRVAYQPQIALDGRGLTGFEALARWARADHGLVAPARFIHVAEESGLIVPLGDWVLRESCAWLATASRLAGRPLRMSVNLSARQITPELPEAIEGALGAAGLQPSQLCLEITETLLISDPQAVEILSSLRRQGLVLSLDDFGTGWSSLAALQRHAVDELKIDRSMVATVGDAPASRAIARAAVDMATALGLSVVAEGVERPDQLHVMRDLGCDLVQGFLFAPSLWADEAADYLAMESWVPHLNGGPPPATGP